MKKKIIGIGIMMLFLATAVLPAVGTLNKSREITPTTTNQPAVEWTKTFDRGEFDHFHTARQTADGGYIACGVTEENNMFYVWLVKVNPQGVEEWRVINYDLNGSKITNTEMWVTAMDILQTADGGYIVCGISQEPFDFEGAEVWLPVGYLWKTDDAGGTEWLHSDYYEIGQQGKSYYLYNILEIENGFVASGFHLYYDLVTGAVVNENGLIMKTDSLGVKQWVRDFEKNGVSDSFSSVSQTSDGGYFLSGYTDAESTSEGALWMLKTDGEGNKQWDTIFDGPKFEYTYGKGNFQTSDGGYVMNGVSASYGHGGTDIWLVKTDASGAKVWDKTYGVTRNDYGWGMCKADNDGFALGICTNYGYTSGTKDDILVVETDKDGNAEWQFQIKEDDIQVTRSISPTSDGGYIIAAMTGNFGYTKTDGILVKIGSFDNQVPAKPEVDGPAKGKPDKNYTFTASATDPDGGVLSYRWDWGDGNYSGWLSTPQATYSWAYEDNFEVRVMAQDDEGGESDWSDPLPIAIPYSYSPGQHFLSWLFQRVPTTFSILRQLLGY